MPRARINITSPRPNSGLPEFGTISRPKSDISDLGWGEVASEAAGEGDPTERMRWPGYCSGTSSSFASCSWESGAAMYLKETASAISGSMPSMRSGSTLFLG